MAKGWKLVVSGTMRKVPAPSEDLQVQKRFIAFPGDELLGTPSTESSELAEPEPCTKHQQEAVSDRGGRLSLSESRGCHLSIQLSSGDFYRLQGGLM